MSETVARHVRVSGNCLVWTGRLHEGYATLPWRGRANREIMVARLLWERWYGPVPEGKRLRNRCGDRACVRVEHWRVQGMEPIRSRVRVTLEYLVEVPGHVDTKLLQTLVAGQLMQKGLPLVDRDHPVALSRLAGKPEPLLAVSVREDRPGWAGSTCMFNVQNGKRRLLREGHLGPGPRMRVDEETAS